MSNHENEIIKETVLDNVYEMTIDGLLLGLDFAGFDEDKEEIENILVDYANYVFNNLAGEVPYE